MATFYPARLPQASTSPRRPSLSPTSHPPALSIRSSLPCPVFVGTRKPLCFLAAGVSALILSAAASRRLSLLSALAWSTPPLRRVQGQTALQGGGAPSPAGARFTAASSAMANVSIGTPAERTISIPPLQEHKATVVFLHGLGDTGQGWADVPGTLQLPNVKWVLPSAPIKPVTLNGGFPMPSWFDILGLSEGTEEDKEGIDRAAQYIAGILREEKAAAPPGTKIIVGGFSQGGATSLHLAVRKQVGSFLDGSDAASAPLDATICLSGWLPLAKTLKGVSLKSPEAAANYPLLQCHGEADPLVLFSFGKHSSETLKALGFTSLQFKSYKHLPHSASPEELQDVKNFLQSLVSS